jgi:hypothetical protein
LLPLVNGSDEFGTSCVEESGRLCTVRAMAGKKRQTMGKIMRERARAEKRAAKQEKKDEKKAAAAAQLEAEALGLPYPPTENGDEADLVAGDEPPGAGLAEAEAEEPLDTPAEELQGTPPRAPDTAG